MSSKQIGLSNVQKELLKIYANGVSDETLFEIKRILAAHFAEKATQEMDKLLEERDLTEQNIIDWTNEHNRVSSRH
ncbi:MAG: hypothetical protein H7Z37_04200 [Pyrinomonadaceae bacterium]|nr:hypothetical protein [Pyrinomonadaceae bacterium]